MVTRLPYPHTLWFSRCWEVFWTCGAPRCRSATGLALP